MAASVMPQPSSHFGTNPDAYSQAMFASYSDQNSMSASNQAQYIFPSETEQAQFASPQKWPIHQQGHRPSSKSPNFRERTPIRHNRSSMSRPRSTSRPDTLLAYAAEQSLQQQQQQPLLPQPHPQHQQSHSGALPQTYGSQMGPFVNHPTTSPYLQQPAYFESPPVNQTAFPQLMAQPISQRTADFYTMSRPEVQLPSVSTTSLNPNDTLYAQSRSHHLPSMSGMPSSFPTVPQPLESTPSEVDVVTSRQKPQCWDHGCNGRQFSTFSNLLRHQREKSGTASKARCPHCGTEFTRTTARNGHLYGGKCKGMPDATNQTMSDDTDEKGDSS